MCSCGDCLSWANGSPISRAAQRVAVQRLGRSMWLAQRTQPIGKCPPPIEYFVPTIELVILYHIPLGLQHSAKMPIGTESRWKWPDAALHQSCFYIPAHWTSWAAG